MGQMRVTIVGPTGNLHAGEMADAISGLFNCSQVVSTWADVSGGKRPAWGKAVGVAIDGVTTVTIQVEEIP